MKKKAAPAPAFVDNRSTSARWIRVALACIVLLLYGQTVTFDYTLDDGEFYEKNSLVQKGVSNIIDIFSKTSLGVESATTVNHPYRPMTMFSFALDKSLFGATASGGHWVNLLLYVLLLQVLFTLLRKLFPDVPPAIAGAITLLYAVHPVHTEVVASIKSRDEILAALFGFWAWIQFLKTGGQDRKSRTAAWKAAGFLSLAMLSKESGIVFLALMPLSRWLLNRSSPASLVRPVFPLFLAAAAFFLVRFIVVRNDQSIVVMRALDNILFTATDLNEATATRFTILFLYLKLLFVPWPLVWDYTFHQIPLNTWSDALPWTGAVCYASISAAALFFLRKSPMIVLGILLFLVSLAPVSNIFFINSTSLGERLLFLPSLGFCISIVLTGWRLVTSRKAPAAKKPLLIVFFVLLAVSSVLTVRSAANWKDNLTLFRHGVAASPQSARTHFNLGIAYWEIVKKSADAEEKAAYTEKAIVEFRKSLEIYPEYFMAMTDLGCLYELKGELDSSRICFERSLAMYSGQPFIVTNVSNILNKKGAQSEVAGDKAQAVRLYLESAAYDKRNTAPLNSLGLLYARDQRYDSAFVFFNAALAINGEDRSTLENFAVTAFLAKDVDKAILLAQKHVTLYGNSRAMLGVLSDCYYAKGNYAEVERLRKLLEPAR